MADLNGLTDEQIRTLQSMVDWWRALPRNPKRVTPAEDVQPSSQVYIAKLSDSGTGTGPTAIEAISGDTLDYADGAIYRRVGDALEAITGLTRRIYNVGLESIAEDEYRVVVKDAFGDWYAIGGSGGGGGSGITTAEVDGSPSYTGITTLKFDSADGFVLSQPGAGQVRLDIAAATASQAGVASLSDQYLGAGQKAVDELAIASSAGSVNAADPVLRAFAHTVSASTRYIIAIERDATPYAAQAPLSAIRFIAFCDADRLPDSQSDTWIQATGLTASEVGQAQLEFHVRGVGADNGFHLLADDYANVGTFSTNANFTAFSAGTLMAGLGFVVGDGSTNAVGQSATVAGLTFTGGILTGGSFSGGTVTSITAGTGLSGGTITSTGTINLADTAVTPGSYTNANLTVDAQGRITAASNGSSSGSSSWSRHFLTMGG